MNVVHVALLFVAYLLVGWFACVFVSRTVIRVLMTHPLQSVFKLTLAANFGFICYI